jgi:uncharacterized membrane protein
MDGSIPPLANRSIKMMRKFWKNLIIDLCLIAFCIFLYKDMIANITGDFLIFYSIVSAIGIFLFYYVGWVLTKAVNAEQNSAMNKAIKNGKDNA